MGFWPWCPHGAVNPALAQPFDPVLVFQDADGSYRFPGRSKEKPPAGSVPLLLRTSRQVHEFERRYGAKLSAKLRAHQETEEGLLEAERREARADIRKAMESMQPDRRRVCEAVMRRNDRERRRRSTEVEFYVEPFSMDSGSRSPWRDVDTGWKPRK